ncbi:MAG: class I adenylate cyclase [Spirochaetes bacterium]|nr:class I adenylate cyclase [Spirochaetota bacterium]
MDFLKLIENNKNKFLEFNQIKYQRFQQFVSNTNTKRVINSIPFLFSVNHKKFPGYVEGEVPLGIYNYELDDDTRRFIKGKYPATTVEISEHIKPFIQMLAIMGSIGTIAYNKKSDFDYWVCIDRSDTTPEKFENFKKKVDAVQKWASSEIKLPVHIFVNDVELVKKNIFAEDEEEAFGSTVGAVLKDEFFRSSIIISGKIPFWWVVPNSFRDAEYDKLFKSLPQETAKNEFVDLGNLYEISREDFLGAALFQIIKSLGNPFKSIIKIGLLEKYLTELEDSHLMSQKVKINVQKGNFDDTILDSYLNMFKEVYDFYSSKRKDKAILEMLKKNLYLKIDPQLSKYIGVKQTKNIPYKVVVMFQFARSWKWNMTKVTDLDNFDNWDFNKVMGFWDLVKKFMLLSYKNISDQLPALKLEKKVSETDFLLLSRKIKTHFKLEPDKIEQFITFKDTPSEAVLYIEPVSQSIDNIEWRLYKRNTLKTDSFITTTLRTENNLLKLLVWASLNQIYDSSFSRVNIQSGYSRINQQHVISVLDQSSNFFKEDKIKLKNEYFLGHAFNLLCFLIINFDIENADSIQTLHFLYHTSWGESYLKDYNSEEELSNILHTVLKDGYKLQKNFDSFCAINTPDQYKKPYKRAISLFKEAYAAIVEDRKNTSVRFVAIIANKYVMFTRDNDNIEMDVYPNLFNFLAAVTLKPKNSLFITFFSNDSVFIPLASLRNGLIRNLFSIAYEEKGNFIIVYIINERGNLFTFVKSISLKDEFLLYLYDFCQNISKRIFIARKSGTVSNEVKIMRMDTDRYGKLSITDESSLIRGKLVLTAEFKRALVTSVSRHQGNETYYNIVFPDKSSSGFIPFKSLVSISTKLIKDKKQGPGTFAIVRDLVFSDLNQNEIEMGSTLYFLEKYKIESMLEKGMKSR